MKLGKFRYGAAVCIIVLMVAMAGIVGASGIGETVKNACSMCHSNKRVCLNLGVKSEADWKATITEMVDQGAQLETGEIGAAARYLAGLAPRTGSVCQ